MSLCQHGYTAFFDCPFCPCPSCGHVMDHCVCHVEAPAPRSVSGGDCAGCGRVMSVRERAEQGVCDECASGDRR